jgi:hypothetical protein
VDKATCKQSAKLVLSTTFSSMYFEANSIASSFSSINSEFAALLFFLTKSFTILGALSNSSAVRAEKRIVKSLFLIRSNSGFVNYLNS